jgi:endo-1,4-beta-xylanase
MKSSDMIKFSRNRLISRRQALRIGISSVTALTVLSLGKLKVLSYLIYTFTDAPRKGLPKKIKDAKNRNFKVVGKNSLKNRAKAKGLIYGAFPEADHQNFKDDPKLRSIFSKDCGLIVTGVYWDQIRPSATTFNFERADYFAKFAADNKMLLRGHPLVYYDSLPSWLKTTITHQNAKKIFTDHLETVVKRYAGKMHSWDVVNEAIDVGDGRADGLRNDIWMKYLGPNFIDIAFRLVARLDPKALRVYNETNLTNEVQQNATLKLLKQLKSKGTPVQALGIQSHLDGAADFNPQQFRKFLRSVSNLGLKILITEIDVMDKDLPMDTNQRDRIVAGVYEDYLAAAFAEKSVIAAINWSLTDSYTWLTKGAPRKDGSPVRPLPFDRDLNPKLAWNAIARALDGAPKR